MKAAPPTIPALSIIVIGASEGGIQAIRSLMAGLPAALKAALFVVLHVGAHKSSLPALLNLDGSLPATHPRDGDPIQAGRIYIAPPDHHLVVERGHVRLTRGPKENWARPAVDPLFRSAAMAYGDRVIGVILTGGLNDGTAGLYEIKRQGGTAIVQDPGDAVNPGMPSSALAHVSVDYSLPLAGIPELLIQLVAAQSASPHRDIVPASARRGEMTAEYKLDDPVAVTCPDCGGALLRTELGSLSQFRCHIGHVYTADVLVAAQFSSLEWSLEAAMRALSERGEICRQMAAKSETAGEAETATRWGEAMREAKDRTDALRKLLEKSWLHPGDALHAPSARRHG